MRETGLIHIYYGNGKGKTTAAIGQAVRAAGYGYRVLVFQFLKDNRSSERKILESIPNITCMEGKEEIRFVFQMSKEEKDACRMYYEEKLEEIRQAAQAYDVLVLDEAVCASGLGILSEERLLRFLRERPEGTEVILTGHSITENLRKAADYVTEMRMERHPFERGIAARNGIEK